MLDQKGEREHMDSTATYYLTNKRRQVTGPFTEEQIKEFIVERRLTANDAVRSEDTDTWVPILNSPFGQLLAEQINATRLAATTCPHCNAALVVTIKRSGWGLALILIGIALTPAFGIGIPIFIAGMIMRHSGKGKAIYRCATCNYSSS